MSYKNKRARIIDNGYIYSFHARLANLMGLKRFKSGFTYDYDLNGEDCIIINSISHDEVLGTGPFYGIYVPSLDRDYIINGDGIEILDKPVYREILEDELFKI